LLSLSKNPLFAGAKDYVMQGLSHRLNPFEKISEADLKEKYQIDLKPRTSYADKVLKPRVEEEKPKVEKPTPESKSKKKPAAVSEDVVKTENDQDTTKEVIPYQSEGENRSQ
jgi:hypothetical protein